jgi:hypothetical protein
MECHWTPMEWESSTSSRAPLHSLPTGWEGLPNPLTLCDRIGESGLDRRIPTPDRTDPAVKLVELAHGVGIGLTGWA